MNNYGTFAEIPENNESLLISNDYIQRDDKNESLDQIPDALTSPPQIFSEDQKENQY